MKDCYLVFDSMDSSSCYYGVKMSYSSDCIDCLNVFESTKCYWLIDWYKCFEVFYSQNCKESQNLYYCNNCIGCLNCINCTGLINKQFYINNAPVSVEEYTSALKDIFLKESQQKKIATIHRHNHILTSTNSSWDYLEWCTNSTCSWSNWYRGSKFLVR
jgi:hypothetical protein